MTTPITERDLPETVMAAMMRFEEEAYRAGQHGCCKGHPSPADMPNPSVFDACDKHGPRCRAALSLLCHALQEFTEEIVSEAREEIARHPEDHVLIKGVPFGMVSIDRARERLAALAPRCPKCGGVGFVPGGYCDCSRGKAFAHWTRLNAPPSASPPDDRGSDPGEGR